MTGLLASGSVLILVIIGLRYALGRKISLRIRYALWLLVALRLLIPIEFGTSPLSLQNFSRESAPTPSALIEPSTESTHTLPSAPVTDPEPLETIPPVTGNAPPVQRPDSTPTTVQPPVSSGPIPEESSLSWKQILILVWIAGAGITFLWFLAVNLRFHRKVKKNARPIDVQGYPFPVFVNRELSSPCLVGLLRPRVYLPREADERTLRHILTHEQTHYRHLDPLWAWVRGLCLCLYWFHPLVWWAAALSRQDCELACDEGALKHLGEQERIPYGDTLLSMISHASRPQELFRTATTMAASKKQLKERVEMIVKQPKKLWIALLCLLWVIALTVGCTFTGANKEEFISPTNNWCDSFRTIISRSGSDTYDGDVASLQLMTELASEKLDALETLDPDSRAYAFLENMLQVADLLEKEGGNSFFELPQWEQQALLEGWYILTGASNVASEEEYLGLLEANAGSWLDPWIFGSSGHILPIENPILPPSMPPKPTTETILPSEEVSLDAFVETYYEDGPFRIPSFTQAVTSGKAFNEEIQTTFASVINGDAPEFTAVNYECYENGSILSVLIEGVKGSSAPLYLSYNIHIATGQTATIWDSEETHLIRPLMLVKDLTERYMENGSFSTDLETIKIIRQNLYAVVEGSLMVRDCIWLDEAGRVQYSFFYYPLDGSEPIRKTIYLEDYQAPENPWTETPQAVELLTYMGLEGFDLPDSERPLCHVPFLLAPGSYAMELNAEILRQHASGYDSLEYSWVVNGDICTLLLQGNRDDLEYRVYTLSYSTGEELTPEKIYTAAGYNKETFMSAAKEAIQNYFFTHLAGSDIPISKETCNYLAAASGGASNVALSKPYMDENGDLWIMGKIFQIAGSSYRWYPIPIEGLPLSQGYLDFLSLPRTELTFCPGFNLRGYSIESLPSGNPLGVYATPSDFQFGSDGIYADPCPSGQVGPVYADTPELLKAKEEHLHRYLSLLFGEGDYTFQYDEAFSIRSPFYTKEDLTVFGNAWGVNISTPIDSPLTELTVKELSENPILDAALRFTGIQAPVIQQRITYESTIDPTDGTVKDYRYTVIEAPEFPSALLTLCKSISITYNPGTSYLHISITNTAEPPRAGTTGVPTGVDFMEAVGDRIPFADRYLTGYVECYYSSQVVLGYYVPCYRVYILNDALTEQYGIPTYTVYDFCNTDFPTNRTEVLPWIN